MRREFPRVPAAFINAIADEGTKDEAIEWLQKTWDELCAVRAEYLVLLNGVLPSPSEADQRDAARLDWALNHSDVADWISLRMWDDEADYLQACREAIDVAMSSQSDTEESNGPR